MNQPEPTPAQVKAGIGYWCGRYWVTACQAAMCATGRHAPEVGTCPVLDPTLAVPTATVGTR